MLRTVLSDGLTTQSAVLKFIGERFRPKADLPEWTSDENVTRHLLKYVGYVDVKLRSVCFAEIIVKYKTM